MPLIETLKIHGIVGFDIDEVLFPWLEPFCAWYPQYYEGGVQPHELTEYRFHDFFGLEGRGEVFRERVYRFHKEFTHLQQPREHAFRVLRRVVNTGVSVVAITSRFHSLRDLTRWQLGCHYPSVFSDLHTCGVGFYKEEGGRHRSKDEVMDELGIQVFIDDHHDYLVPLANRGGTSVLFGQFAYHPPADKRHPGIVHVEDWLALEQLLFS